MISAIMVVSDRQSIDETDQAHEVVVRSLVWLVSAVVAGIVRDVTLANPPGFGLSEVADQSGCALVEAEDEASRIEAAVAAARNPRLLVLRAGYQIDARICEDLETFLRRRPADASGFILADPETAAQRLFPNRAPVIGVLTSKAACRAIAPRSFARLARAMRGAERLRTRGTRIV